MVGLGIVVALLTPSLESFLPSTYNCGSSICCRSLSHRHHPHPNLAYLSVSPAMSVPGQAFGDDMFTFIVGPDGTRVTAHKNKIADMSAPLKAMMTVGDF